VFFKVGTLEIEDALAKLADDGINLAIVETPPAITGAISYVVACADLLIVPTRPSPHDLRAVGATVDIADYHGKGVVFVVNDATPRARITAEAAVALSQHGVVAPVTIHNRVDFAASMIDGRTVGEVMPQSRSAEEIRELWTYIMGRLNRSEGAARSMARSQTLGQGLTPVMPDDPQPEPASGLQPESTVALEPASAAAPQRAPSSSALLPPMPDDDVYEWSPAPPPNHGSNGGEPPVLSLGAAAPVRAVPEVNRPGAPGFVERRSGVDRRQALEARPLQGPDRRVASPFGRRSTDRPA
jgi:chromosome partitioning protein